MRRNLVIGFALLIVALAGAAVAYYQHETRSREIIGSPTDEFVATDNAVDRPALPPPPAATPGPRPKPAKPAPRPAGLAWPTYGRDRARTHVAPDYVHRPPYRRLWTLGSGHVELPPAVAYGMVFVAQQRGRFYAVDAETGKIVWTKRFRRCAAASPTVWRGIVYQAYMHDTSCERHKAGARGFIIAMDARTGRQRWVFRAGAIESSPLLVDGVLYFGSWDRYVYALDARTKRLRWRFRADDQVVAAPAYANRTIYVPSSGGRLYALDARTGRMRWRASSFTRFGRREYFYATPTVAYGRVFIGNADGYVYAYGARTGRLLWAQRAGTYVYTAAAVWRQRVFVGTWDGYAVAFDAATGRTRWRHEAPGGISGAPTVMAGLVYFSTIGKFGAGRHERRVKNGPNVTFALDARTGRLRWRFPDGQYSPIVADRERVYLVGRTRVYALAERKRTLSQAKPKPERRKPRSR